MVTSFFRIVAGLAFAIGLTSCAAADDCPPTQQDQEWASACFDVSASGERRVRPAYADRIKTNQHGMVLITIAQPRELVVVDRKGIVTIPGIRHTGDFDYPQPPGGLGRYDAPVTRGQDGARSQCGYFDVRTLRVVIPATYDQCQAFEQGVAKVCHGCVRYCTMRECQDSILIGGKGLSIDRNGHVLRQSALPTLSEVCQGRGTATVEKTSGPLGLLACVDGKDHKAR